MPFLCAEVYRRAYVNCNIAESRSRQADEGHKDIFFYSSFFLYDSFALLVLISSCHSLPEEKRKTTPVPQQRVN